MAYINVGNGPGLAISSIVSLVIAWLFFSVRIYVRWFMLKIWKIEDWLFVGSQFSFTILAVCALMAAIHGNGQKIVHILPADLPIAMKYWFICEIFFILTLLLMRLSIGFYILNFCGGKKRFSWTIKITMGVMSFLTVIYFFFTVFQCSPVRYFWLQFSGLKGSCFPAVDVQNITIAYSTFAAITDMIFGILPMFVIWNLKMNRKAKMIVGALLMVGVIAGLTVIVRIYYIRQVSLTEDFLFATSMVSIWSMIEPAIGIACMSISTYRPLFKSLRDKTTQQGSSHKLSGYPRSKNDSGSIPINTSGNFRLSRSMRSKNGYLKSVDVKNSNSYEDVMTLESMATGQQNGSGSGAMWMGDDEEKGIMTSTTVEITRQQRS